MHDSNLISLSFFKKPDYGVAVAEYADANKQPIAINELVSLGLLPTNATDFTGAAMVLHLGMRRHTRPSSRNGIYESQGF
jgi:hypothetical protein